MLSKPQDMKDILENCKQLIWEKRDWIADGRKESRWLYKLEKAEKRRYQRIQKKDVYLKKRIGDVVFLGKQSRPRHESQQELQTTELENRLRWITVISDSGEWLY